MFCQCSQATVHLLPPASLLVLKHIAITEGLGSYRSCRRPAHRRKRFQCEISARGTFPRRSQRCTGPVGCHWCWSCWSGCRTTASLSLEVLCRRVLPPSWCPHTSSWWSPLTRQRQTPQNWGWVLEKPATRALASWSRPDRRKWNEKATNPGFRYVATVSPSVHMYQIFIISLRRRLLG